MALGDGGVTGLSDPGESPTNVAAIAGDLYWITAAGIARAPKEFADASTSVIVPGVITELVVDETTLAWIDDSGHLGWCSPPQCDLGPSLAIGQDSVGPALTPNAFFWLASPGFGDKLMFSPR
jgi:hypothetical protein